MIQNQINNHQSDIIKVSNGREENIMMIGYEQHNNNILCNGQSVHRRRNPSIAAFD